MFNPHYNRYLMYGERYPTPAGPAQPPYGADGLYPMPDAGAVQGTMAGPYIPDEALMSGPTAAPLPGSGPMGESMARAGAEGQELQRMLDNVMTPGGVFGVPTMPRMGAGAGFGPGWSEMDQSASPGKAPARRRPASKMQKKVMAMFGGDMGAYNQWYNSLPESAGAHTKKMDNWSKVHKYMVNNPRSAPGAAPALNLPFNMMENLEAAPEPGAVEAPSPDVGHVSSVGEGAGVPRQIQGGELGAILDWVGGGAEGEAKREAARARQRRYSGFPVGPGAMPPEAEAPGMVASAGPAMPHEPMTGYGAPAPAPEYGYGDPLMSMEIPQAPQAPPQAPPMDLSEHAQYRQFAAGIPTMTRAEMPAHLRHLMPRAPAPAVERPMGYFDEAFDFGLEAGLPMDEARSAAFGMARERDPDYWGSYDLGGGGAAPPPGAVASAGPTMSYEPTALGPFAPVPEPEADYWGGPSVREVADPYGYGARAEYILGGGATGPAASGPAFNMAANLEQGLARDDPRSPEDQLRNPMPPGVNYRYSMAGNLLPEPRGVAGPAFDMAANLGEGPYDMSADLLPPGEDASMMQQLAHRKRIRQGAARARTGRRAQDIQAQAQYISQLMKQDKRAEARQRQEEALMGMAQRLQDTGTLHAPGPSAGRYTAGYQPLPQLPSPMHMAEDPMRLPAMDLNEYRRQVMMEMLLNQSGRPVAYDPALLDTLGQ